MAYKSGTLYNVNQRAIKKIFDLELILQDIINIYKTKKNFQANVGIKHYCYQYFIKNNIFF